MLRRRSVPATSLTSSLPSFTTCLAFITFVDAMATPSACRRQTRPDESPPPSADPHPSRRTHLGLQVGAYPDDAPLDGHLEGEADDAADLQQGFLTHAPPALCKMAVSQDGGVAATAPPPPPAPQHTRGIPSIAGCLGSLASHAQSFNYIYFKKVIK